MDIYYCIVLMGFSFIVGLLTGNGFSNSYYENLNNKPSCTTLSCWEAERTQLIEETAKKMYLINAEINYLSK